MKNSLSATCIAILFVVIPSTLIAQQWNDKQQEVWKAVEGIANNFYSGNIEGFYKMVHPDFVFWNSANSVPGDIKTARELDTTWFEKLGGRWHAVLFTPLTILVFDDFAVVNFYVRGFMQEPGGQAIFKTQRVHTVIKKEGSVWLQLACYVDSEG